MMSKLKLISGVSAVFVFSFLLLVGSVSTSVVSAQQAPGTLFIYSPQTGQGATVYYGPQRPPATTTIATSSMPMILTGTSTCGVLMNSFHKYGDSGLEVVRLQNFLNQYMNAGLNGKGFYGPATKQAVKNLQYTYGIKVTGYQHEKTTALINSLVCGNIAVRQPLKATGSTYTGYMGTVNIGNGKVTTTNVYPNANAGVAPNVVKNYPNKGNGVMIPKDNGTKTSMTSTSSNSFWNNFKSDLEKIKENYKAYVLVFVLVLALFWFLRKAATE